MNFIFLFIFNLFLLNGYLMANIDRESSRGEVQPQNNSAVGTEVDLFHEDFLYPMFEAADFEQMLKFAKDPRISDFVKTQIFPVKYQNHMFYIVGNENGNIGFGGSVVVSQESLSIYDHNLFFYLLKNVGKSIKKLGIVNEAHLDHDHSAFIQRQVNEYCSDSLTYFSMGPIKENAFTQYTKPFSKLIDLNLLIAVNQVGPSLTFNEIFPKVQRLSLGYFDFGLDTQFLGGELPHIEHLEHFEVFVPSKNSSNIATITTQLENFLQKNSHIRSLTYKTQLGDFIQVINNNLPNLENFTIWELDPEIQPVQFDQVKHFVAYREFGGPLERISFSNLESVSMIYPSSSWNDVDKARYSWIDFFRNHLNLRKLNCRFYHIHGLSELLAESPNLNEFAIKSYENFDMDLIRRLIEDHKNLLKFQYHVRAFNNFVGPDLSIYREQFGNEWNITLNICHRIDEEVGNWFTLTFERNN